MGKRIFVHIILILELFSCKGQNKTHLNNSDSTAIQIGKVIPFSRSETQLRLKDLGNQMGLPVIYNGMKGMYVRIWLWGSNDSSYIVNIADDGSNKGFDIVGFNIEKKDNREYIKINRVQKGLKPKSGWKNFISIMKKYQIADMENGTIDKKIKWDLTRMDYIQFEIARLNQHRLYGYLEPGYYRYVDTNSNKIYKFLQFLNKEMKIQVYTPKNAIIKPKKN